MRKMKKTDTKAQLWLDEAWGGGGGVAAPIPPLFHKEK